MTLTESVRYVPAYIRDWVKWLEDKTGADILVDQTDSWCWTILIENKRIKCTVDFKRNSSRKVVWVGSELWVDGEKRPNVSSHHAFVRLFNDPDSDPEIKPKWTPDPAPEERPFEDAPVVAQNVYNQLAKKINALAELDGLVKIGFEDNQWVVFLITEMEDLRFWFENPGQGWKPRHVKPVTLVIEGHDYSAEIKNGMLDVIRLLTTRPGAMMPEPGGPRRPEDAKRNVSVQTRRATVIRN